MQLTDNQRRHLTIYLAQVEDAVEALEQLATDRTHERVLRVDRRDLPEDFGGRNRDDLSLVRSGLAEMAQTFQLTPLQRSRAREALGLLTIAIVQLQDAGSRGLRGYGPVDPDLPEVLDPALDRLRAVLVSVAGRLSSPASNGEAATS